MITVAKVSPMNEDAATMKLLRDVAIRHLLTVDPSASLRRAAKVMTERGVGCAVVVQNEKVVGIVTERDILRAIAADKVMDDATVDEVMTRDVVSGAPGWDIMRASRAMQVSIRPLMCSANPAEFRSKWIVANGRCELLSHSDAVALRAGELPTL